LNTDNADDTSMIVSTTTPFKERKELKSITIPSSQTPKINHIEESVCDLSTDIAHLEDVEKFDYPDQIRAGPMQADEMLLIFSLIRTTFITRILELGGLRGDSAYNFLKALRCKGDQGVVYTVDKQKVEQHDSKKPGRPRHVTIMKDAADLTSDDFDHKPIDMVLLDCHSYKASKHVLQTLWHLDLFAPNAYIVLHDTGMHPPGNYFSKNSLADLFSILTDAGNIHQPVERLLADWIPHIDCSFQRISFHDDQRSNTRHGVTIMQRKMVLDFFDECKRILSDGKSSEENAKVQSLHDFTTEDCEEVKASTLTMRKVCPIKTATDSTNSFAS